MKKIQRNIFPIIVFILALAIIGYFVWGNKGGEKEAVSIPAGVTTLSSNLGLDTSEINPLSKACYLEKTAAKTEGIFDVEYIEVNYAEGPIVTGFISKIPAGKEKESGNFTGVQNGEFLNIVYTGNKGTENWEEQEILKVEEGRIIESAHKEKAENENGVLVYIDPSDVSFSDIRALPEVDCATVNKVEVGLE